jgi:ATP-dependent helicase/nuclease subunit B
MIDQFAADVGKTLRGELMLSSARNQYLLARIRKTLERVCATQKAVLGRGAFRPAFAELNFGLGERALPPLAIRTPRGNEVLLRGKIDRVDLARDGGEVAVIDYKMKDNKLQLDQVYHGLSLQLLTYLLVLQASGPELFKKNVTPVAAFYAKLLRTLESINHPNDAPDPSDPAFPLRTKPRGIFDGRYAQQLDDALEPGMSSEVVNCRINKDGTFGNVNASDAADSSTFAALMRFVENRIGELADQLIAGTIEVRPYMIGTQTPCPNCNYRSVCRFDPGINQYFVLPAMKRAAVLERIAEPVQAAQGASDAG